MSRKQGLNRLIDNLEKSIEEYELVEQELEEKIAECEMAIEVYKRMVSNEKGRIRSMIEDMMVDTYNVMKKYQNDLRRLTTLDGHYINTRALQVAKELQQKLN